MCAYSEIRLCVQNRLVPRQMYSEMAAELPVEVGCMVAVMGSSNALNNTG